MKKKLVTFISPLLLLSSFHLFADSPTPAKLNEQLALTDYNKQVAWSMAAIKSKSDLVALGQVESPLDLLTPAAKERFIESVVFTENGIGGFYYSDLEAELTPSQIYKILSLIGAQHTVSTFNRARVETQADILLLNPPTQSDLRQFKGVKEGEITPMRRAAKVDSRCDYVRQVCVYEVGSICICNEPPEK